MANEDIFHLGLKALIRNKAGKILILKGSDTHKSFGHWDLPGGRIHKGENMDDEHSEFKWASPKEAAELLNVKFSDQFVKKLARIA